MGQGPMRRAKWLRLRTCAALLRETFATPNPPQHPAATRAQRERAVPRWVKAAASLGIPLG
jgi:hypothetical protein